MRTRRSFRGRSRSNPRKSLWITANRSGTAAAIASTAPNSFTVVKWGLNFGAIQDGLGQSFPPNVGMEDPTLARVRGSFSLAANFGAGGDWFDFRVGIIKVGYQQSTAAEMPNPLTEYSDDWLWYKSISGIASAGVGSLWNAAGSTFFEIDAKSKRRLVEGDDLAFVLANHANSRVSVYCHFSLRALFLGARRV